MVEIIMECDFAYLYAKMLTSNTSQWDTLDTRCLENKLNLKEFIRVGSNPVWVLSSLLTELLQAVFAISGFFFKCGSYQYSEIKMIIYIYLNFNYSLSDSML